MDQHSEAISWDLLFSLLKCHEMLAQEAGVLGVRALLSTYTSLLGSSPISEKQSHGLDCSQRALPLKYAGFFPGRAFLQQWSKIKKDPKFWSIHYIERLGASRGRKLHVVACGLDAPILFYFLCNPAEVPILPGVEMSPNWENMANRESKGSCKCSRKAKNCKVSVLAITRVRKQNYLLMPFLSELFLNNVP